MFENRKPKFEMGKILKVDMLNSLNNYPRDFWDVYYKDYCDGIIKGCDINIYDNYILISKGILKYKNNIYILPNEEKFNYECNNKYNILKIRFFEQSEKDNFELNLSDIVLDENLELEHNEMEICRFKLREGAKLRNDYVDFTDFSTEYDTVNIINSPYSSISGQTLSPQIMRDFAKEIVQYNLQDAYDISFVFMLLNSSTNVEKEVIESFIRKKISIQDKELKNEDIYNYLLQILNTIKNNGDSIGCRNGRRRKILLD